MQFQEKDRFSEHKFAQEQCKSFKQRQNETVFGQKLRQTQLKQIKKLQRRQTQQLKHGKSRLFGIQHVKSRLVGRKENSFKLIVKDAVTGSVKNWEHAEWGIKKQLADERWRPVWADSGFGQRVAKVVIAQTATNSWITEGEGKENEQGNLRTEPETQAFPQRIRQARCWNPSKGLWEID